MTARIKIDGRELRPPTDYSIDFDILEPADAFSMTLPLDAESVAVAALDAPFQVMVDDTVVISGLIDEAEETADGSLAIRGRDRVGRLVDESVPGAGMRLGQTTVEQAALRIVRPWFDRVEFSNAENRRLVRGRGRKTRSGREPALTAAQRRQIPRRIDAGAKRWEALMAILEPLRLLAWSRGDGKALVIAAPNYNQAPQYQLVEEFTRSNVTAMSRRRATADRYATIEVSGSGRPPGVPAPPWFPAYPGQKRPKYVNRGRVGIARDTTGDFRSDKRLFVISEAMSQGEAQELAARAMGQGLVNAEQISITVPEHGQRRPGTSIRTLYAPDTVARVRRQIERAPGDDAPTVLVSGDYLITRVSMTSSRGQGEQTQLSLSPLGVELS
jgi:prophage tail gpP-like protein